MDNTPGENDSLHENSIELAQLLLDHVIDCFYYNPFLTNADKLFLVHEYRRLIDDAEQMLISSPDRPFHVDGHEDRINDVLRQLQEGIKKTGHESKLLNT